jgi:hypothetical protein
MTAKGLTNRGIDAGVSLDGNAIRRDCESVHVDRLHLERVDQRASEGEFDGWKVGKRCREEARGGPRLEREKPWDERWAVDSSEWEQKVQQRRRGGAAGRCGRLVAPQPSTAACNIPAKVHRSPSESHPSSHAILLRPAYFLGHLCAPQFVARISLCSSAILLAYM